MEGTVNQSNIRLGAASFTQAPKNDKHNETAVHFSCNETYKGKFVFQNHYRKGVYDMFEKLSKRFDMLVLSGDNEGEKAHLEQTLPKDTTLIFNQKPEDKLNYIQRKQRSQNQVLMLGDGLNDAGALAQSNVGIAVSENVNVFSPAGDAILDASVLDKLPKFLKLRANLSALSRRVLHFLFCTTALVCILPLPGNYRL